MLAGLFNFFLGSGVGLTFFLVLFCFFFKRFEVRGLAILAFLRGAASAALAILASKNFNLAASIAGRSLWPSPPGRDLGPSPRQVLQREDRRNGVGQGGAGLGWRAGGQPLGQPAREPGHQGTKQPCSAGGTNLPRWCRPPVAPVVGGGAISKLLLFYLRAAGCWQPI